MWKQTGVTMSKSKLETIWLCSEKTILQKTRIGNLVSARVRNSRTSGEAEFYCLDFADWVNIVAVTPDKQFIFIRQYRFGTGRLELEIPGGAVEPGESPLEAGIRELREETGFGGGKPQIIGEVCPNPAIQSNRCYTVAVENVVRLSAPRLDDMEDIEVLTLDGEEVDALITDSKITHGLVLNALMFYNRFINR